MNGKNKQKEWERKWSRKELKAKMWKGWANWDSSRFYFFKLVKSIEPNQKFSSCMTQNSKCRKFCRSARSGLIGLTGWSALKQILNRRLAESANCHPSSFTWCKKVIGEKQGEALDLLQTLFHWQQRTGHGSWYLCGLGSHICRTSQQAAFRFSLFQVPEYFL